ncbi:MAG: 7-cyano-7-deazaguanine synthase QueC [Parachlamydiaceae bacterium]|nr:7-cyano-7-deazaguanine synthase QueC [Parachlamydiaceae bacterium]
MTKAIVLLSGGIDSTVVLALALSHGKNCYALSFNYGQKHIVELEAAKEIAKYYKVPHHIINIDPKAFGKSSLVSNIESPKERSLEEMITKGIPNTYVPARNTLFLAFALGQCELHEAQEIHFGSNLMDYACYPDCRPTYMQAYQSLMNLATKQAVEGNPPSLITPLIYFDKKSIIKKGLSLGAPLELTISCYNPIDRHTPCNQCDACILRNMGFAEVS